jgi:hypothetical protein
VNNYNWGGSGGSMSLAEFLLVLGFVGAMIGITVGIERCDNDSATTCKQAIAACARSRGDNCTAVDRLCEAKP